MRIESCCSIPKRAHELHASTRIVPNIKPDSSPGAGNPDHFGERLLLVGHKIQNQRRHNNVSAGCLEGQPLRVAYQKRGAPITFALALVMKPWDG